MVHFHAVWSATMGKLGSAMRRTALSALVLISIAPASAFAADPLLSGYGGPGGGEQAVLGDELLPASGGGGDSGGSLKAQPAPATTTGAARLTPTPRKGGSGEGRSTGGDSSKSSKSRDKGDTTARSGADTASGQATDRNTLAAPELVAYPDEARSSAGLLSGGDVMLALLGILALSCMALGLRRLVGGGLRPPGG